MNILIFCFLLIFVAATAAVDVDFKALGQTIRDCAEITHTKESEYASVTVLLDVPSMNLQCMGKCLMEKLEIVDERGEIKQDVLKDYVKNLPIELRSKIIQCTEDYKTVTACEDIGEIRNCLLPTIHKMMTPSFG